MLLPGIVVHLQLGYKLYEACYAKQHFDGTFSALASSTTGVAAHLLELVEMEALIQS